MKPEMGPPEIETWSYPGEDKSWDLEFEAFLDTVNGLKTHLASGNDALRAVEIIYDVYRQNKVNWLSS